MKLNWSASVWTFYNEALWEGRGWDALVAYSKESPKEYWPRLLDMVQQTKSPAIELAIDPSDWHTAIAAYGSTPEFIKALESHDLRLSSSYEFGSALRPAATDSALADAFCEAVAEHSAFVAECGADLLLAGPPGRVTDEPEDFVKHYGELLNRAGQVSMANGVRFVLHTEGYSRFALNGEIDEVMAATDPDFVSLCIDPGHVTLTGGNAAQMFRDHAARVPIIHWKDSKESLPSQSNLSPDEAEGRMGENFCRVGTGATDWTAFGAALVDYDYSGWSVAEYDSAPDPVADTFATREFGDGLVTTQSA